MKAKELIAATLVVALLGALGYVWLSGSGVRPAPQTTFTLLDGEKLDLSSLRGKPVMVTFWATSCPGCRDEVPHLIDLYREFQSRGLEIIAVAMAYDPPAQVLEFRNRKNLPYKVALDLDSKSSLAFGDVRLTPTTFVISGDGHIVFEKVGSFEVPVMHALIEKLLDQRAAA
jgi:peroxiredoxin